MSVLYDIFISVLGRFANCSIAFACVAPQYVVVIMRNLLPSRLQNFFKSSSIMRTPDTFKNDKIKQISFALSISRRISSPNDKVLLPPVKRLLTRNPDIGRIV